MWSNAIKKPLLTLFTVLGIAGMGFSYTWDTADITPLMTSNTAPTPNVVSASSEINSSYAAYMAFDHAGFNFWRTADPDTLPEYIKFDFGSGNTYAAYGYKITNWPDDSNYSPTAWQLHGSNNDSAWTLLDTQAAISWASGGLTKAYSFSNAVQFRYYRFTFSAVNAGTSMKIGEIEIFGTAARSPYIF